MTERSRRRHNDLPGVQVGEGAVLGGGSDSQNQFLQDKHGLEIQQPFE